MDVFLYFDVRCWTLSVRRSRLISFCIHQSAFFSSGKPAGVSGASIFSYVGAVPPADMSAWKFEGNTSKTAVQVVFPNETAAGATVWLTAFWFNPRKQSGPACAPVSTNVQGGSVSLAA